MKTMLTVPSDNTDMTFSFLMTEGISNNDRLVFLCESGTDCTRTLQEIRDLLERASCGAHIEEVQLDMTDFDGMLKTIAGVMEGQEKLVVDLTGGTSRTVAALTVCCTAFAQRVSRTYTYCTRTDRFLETPLPYFEMRLSDTEKAYLRLLSGGDTLYL